MRDQLLLDTPGRRAAAYWFVDGLPEIVVGTGWAGLGAGALWFHRIQPHPWSLRLAFLAFMLLLLGAVFVYRHSITLFLKSRITFPRTGYVSPPSDWYTLANQQTIIALKLQEGQRPPDQNFTRFRSTIWVMILGNAMAQWIGKPVGVPIATSAMAVLLYVLRRDSECPYHWASVLPLPVAGLAAMSLQMGQDDNSWAPVLIGGFWLAAQGAWRLWGYLRKYPSYDEMERLRQ